MSNMFQKFSSLKEFNLSNLRDIGSMFSKCSSLTELDLSILTLIM